MNIFEHQLAKAATSKHDLAVISQQLGLLTRLLQQDSNLEGESLNTIPMISNDLDHICTLVSKVAEQVELMYRYISVHHQLPDTSLLNHSSNSK